MISAPYRLMRRALPLVAYCSHARGHGDVGQVERALLVALGADVLRRVEETISALVSDADRDAAVVRDLERCRRRLRAAASNLGPEVSRHGYSPLRKMGLHWLFVRITS